MQTNRRVCRGSNYQIHVPQLRLLSWRRKFEVERLLCHQHQNSPRPVDSTTYRDEERREAGNHRRSASATPGPAGRFAVASTPPKGCSAAMGKGHHSYSLPTAAHREQDMEARRETRGAPRARAGWGISAASGPRHRDTRRHTRGTAGHEGCK